MNEMSTQPEWLSTLTEFLRKHVIAFLSVTGVAFNLISIAALLTKRFTFKKTITYLLVLLNLSDSLFLVCTFVIFCIRYFGETCKDIVTYVVPFLLPLSQTFLTISVYSVIAITLQGVVYIQANRPQTPDEESTDQNDDQDEESMNRRDSTNSSISSTSNRGDW